MDPQGASSMTSSVHVGSRSPKAVLRSHQQPVVVEIHWLCFYVKVPLLVLWTWRPTILQLVTELGEGRTARGGGGGVRGGARLGIVSISYTSIDSNQANAFLAANVGAVGPRVGESLLTVGTLVRLLPC